MNVCSWSTGMCYLLLVQWCGHAGLLSLAWGYLATARPGAKAAMWYCLLWLSVAMTPALAHVFFSSGLTWEQLLLQRNSQLLILCWWLVSLPDHSSPFSFCPLWKSRPVSSMSSGEATISSISMWLRDLSLFPSSPCTSLHLPPWSAPNTMTTIKVSSLLLPLTQISLWVLMLKLVLNFADFLPNISLIQPFWSSYAC